MLVFYSEEMLAPCETPKLEDHMLSSAGTAYSIHSLLPSIYEGHLMHLQPEDLLFYVDRDPLNISETKNKG
jgi:hypothetical protein